MNQIQFLKNPNTLGAEENKNKAGGGITDVPAFTRTPVANWICHQVYRCRVKNVNNAHGLQRDHRLSCRRWGDALNWCAYEMWGVQISLALSPASTLSSLSLVDEAPKFSISGCGWTDCSLLSSFLHQEGREGGDSSICCDFSLSLFYYFFLFLQLTPSFFFLRSRHVAVSVGLEIKFFFSYTLISGWGL